MTSVSGKVFKESNGKTHIDDVANADKEDYPTTFGDLDDDLSLTMSLEEQEQSIRNREDGE